MADVGRLRTRLFVRSLLQAVIMPATVGHSRLSCGGALSLVGEQLLFARSGVLREAALRETVNVSTSCSFLLYFL